MLPIFLNLISYGRFNYIGHTMDHFSKHHVLFPLETKSADEVATMVQERVLAYLGPPKMEKKEKKWKPDVTFFNGRPHHSQSQGIVERGNRTVEMKIAQMENEANLTDNMVPWCSWLPESCIA